MGRRRRAATVSTEARRLGAAVRRLRRARGLSVERLAERAGVGRSTLSQIERGECAPTINVAARIAAALDVDLAALASSGAPRRRAVVLRADAGRVRRLPDGAAAVRALHPGGPAIAPFFQLVVAPGAGVDLAAVHAGSHVTIAATDHALDVTVAGVTHRLAPGDALHVHGGACRIANPGADEAFAYVTADDLTGTRRDEPPAHDAA